MIMPLTRMVQIRPASASRNAITQGRVQAGYRNRKYRCHSKDEKERGRRVEEVEEAEEAD